MDFTESPEDLISNVLNNNDYYQIFRVDNNATNEEIKKAYKKIAKQLHPDKNKATGAGEAFKVVNKALHVLTNEQLRSKYDAARQLGNYDEEIDQIIRRFFGSDEELNEEENRNSCKDHHHTIFSGNFVAFGLCMGLMLIILISNSDPKFSLSSSTKFSIKRITENLNVPYYVKEVNNYPDDHLEHQVEKAFIDKLKDNCEDELYYRTDILRKALMMRNPSCEQLATILEKERT